MAGSRCRAPAKIAGFAPGSTTTLPVGSWVQRLDCCNLVVENTRVSWKWFRWSPDGTTAVPVDATVTVYHDRATNVSPICSREPTCSRPFTVHSRRSWRVRALVARCRKNLGQHRFRPQDRWLSSRIGVADDRMCRRRCGGHGVRRQGRSGSSCGWAGCRGRAGGHGERGWHRSGADDNRKEGHVLTFQLCPAVPEGSSQ